MNINIDKYTISKARALYLGKHVEEQWIKDKLQCRSKGVCTSNVRFSLRLYFPLVLHLLLTKRPQTHYLEGLSMIQQPV